MSRNEFKNRQQRIQNFSHNRHQSGPRAMRAAMANISEMASGRLDSTASVLLVALLNNASAALPPLPTLVVGFSPPAFSTAAPPSCDTGGAASKKTICFLALLAPAGMASRLPPPLLPLLPRGASQETWNRRAWRRGAGAESQRKEEGFEGFRRR